jgi:hypothetical protein
MSLVERFGFAVLVKALREPGTWEPYPRISERARWESLPAAVRQRLIDAGERALATPWPNITATSYLATARTGDRLVNETRHFPRRHLLKDLVLAECVEQRGRFLDPIIDAIWSTCEESYWGWTSHLALQQAGVGLPDVEEPTVDLGVSDSCATMAWVRHLLAPALDAVNPLVTRRIELEIRRRMLDVLHYRRDFWWMGLLHHEPINNWAPWIVSNWFTALLLLERDARRRAEDVVKGLTILDRFLSTYGEDGGCDEGPRYWARAASSLADALRVLRWASGGAINGYELPKIKPMAGYLHQMRIVGFDYVNFGDTEVHLRAMDPLLPHRFGLEVGDRRLTALGRWLHECRVAAAAVGISGGGTSGGGARATGRSHGPLCMEHQLAAVFHEYRDDTTPADLHPPRDIWIPSIQTMIARDGENEAGFYLAAKAAHNGQSHNHNDIGQYIVYLDGRALLVDAGVATYTVQTFNSQRYTLWMMQSGWHNLPTINGVMQHQGAGFAAREVRYHADDASATLAMDLAGAYPAEAAIRSWRRSITLSRGQAVRATDEYELTRPSNTLSWSLLTPSTVEIIEGTTLRLHGVDMPGARHSGDATIRLHLPATPRPARIHVETRELNDAVMANSWPDRLHRICIDLSDAPPTGRLAVEVTR